MSTFNDSILTHLAGTWDTVLTETVEELRDNLVSVMRTMSRNADHPGWCAYSDNLEDKCDCIVSELIEVVRGGK